MKVIDFMNLTQTFEFDVCDAIYDWVAYLGVHDNENCDDYDKLMRFFANNIEVVDLLTNGNLQCKVTDFIKEHYDAFLKFVEEENDDNYKPSSYDEFDLEGEDFYDIFLNTFENLLIGNYSDLSYTKLLKYLTYEKENN